MDKEKIIKILEDYEFFVDDDFGGHYEHINCSQKALTPLGILAILDCISNLEQQCKKQKEVIDRVRNNLEKDISMIKTVTMCKEEIITRLEVTDKMLKEVSE